MPVLGRRRLLKLAAGGVAGTVWWRSGRAEKTRRDGSQSDAYSPESADFEPTVHGFGFSNWEGNSGTGADGEGFTYDSGTVTEEDVEQALDSWRTALSEVQQKLVTRIVYSWIGSNAATNGHCYGMTLSADAYFQNPSELPDSVDVASEIPHPTDSYGTVGDRIRRLQTSQLLRAEPYWFAFLGMRWGLADHRESLGQVIEALEETGTAPLALDGEANPHMVLAHGYEHRDDVTDVFIYDPSYEAAEHENPDIIWTLSVDRDSGDVLEIEDGYDEFLYHDPEMELSTVDRLIGARDRVLEMLSDAVFFGLETGGTLELDVPEDVFVDRLDGEYVDADRAPYAEMAVVFDSPDEFEVSIDGDAGDEYALDAFGLRGGDLVIEEAVSDTLDEVPARLQFTVDEAGELVVEVAGNVEEGAAEAAEEGAAVEQGAAEAVEEGATEAVEEAEEANDGAGWFADNWWIPAAGGALGLAAVYRLFVHRSDDEDGP